MQTSRISKLRRPAAVPTLRLPGLRETATALLRVLSVGVPASKDAARIIMLDPVLVFELLQTSPLQKNESASLLEALTQRVEKTDAGLLQASALRHIRAATPAPGKHELASSPLPFEGCGCKRGSMSGGSSNASVPHRPN